MYIYIYIYIYIYVCIYVVGSQDPNRNKAQVNTRPTRIIIHTNICSYTHKYMYIYIYRRYVDCISIYLHSDVNYMKKEKQKHVPKNPAHNETY